MDTFSSVEEVVIKTRKHYTITKQRERWTDEEHNRFLEALKLYGRAWQRIEEYIGTKTAVQIRSHAQKFFSKLEKEALLKGVSIGEALDIEIPPPRPKRKPSKPYPRKNNAATPTSQTRSKGGKLVPTSSLPCKPALDLEKEPLSENANGDERPTAVKENNDENQAKVYNILPAAPCSSVSSATKISTAVAQSLRNPCALREFIPPVKEVVNENETNESFVTTELKHNLKWDKDDAKQAERCNGTSKPSRMANLGPSQVKLSSTEKIGDLNCPSSIDDMQGTQNYPRHVPVQVLDAQFHSHAMSCKDCIFHPAGQHNLFPNSASSNANDFQNNRVRSSIHQSSPSYPPFTTALNNQDDYQSFLHRSTTFSSLIVSTLLQNPAAHAAANFAATFWPYANIETSAISPASSQGFTSRQMGSTPSITAIAAATVAAATAWWAAHGLFPLYSPIHTAFTCAPASAAGMVSMDTGQAPAAKICEETIIENHSLQEKPVDAEHPEAIGQIPALRSLAISSSESEKSGDLKQSSTSKVIDHDKSTGITEHNDSNKAKDKKQVDPSCCGSNTTSGSEIETDALEKGKNGKEDSKTREASQTADSSNRCGRICSNSSDSWKDVCEEGRLAFQALFTREVLAQIFSPPEDQKDKDHEKENIQISEQTMDDKAGEASTLDLNSKNCNPLQQRGVKSLPLMEHGMEEGQLTIGLEQGKLKVRRTGFKPYKRCSVEAKKNRVGHASNRSEEKCPKRIRLEGEASA